jgi:hypothetical protein
MMAAPSSDALRSALAAQAAAYRTMGANPGAWLAEEFVARLGIACTAQALPRRYRRGPMKRCFENAAALVGRTQSRRRLTPLRYCEGFVSRPGVPILIHHGWAIDADARVIDPTLPDPEDCAYVGVPIPWDEYEAETRLTIRAGLGSASVLLDVIGCVRAEYILAHCPDILALMPHRETAA